MCCCLVVLFVARDNILFRKPVLYHDGLQKMLNLVLRLLRAFVACDLRRDHHALSMPHPMHVDSLSLQELFEN